MKLKVYHCQNISAWSENGNMTEKTVVVTRVSISHIENTAHTFHSHWLMRHIWQVGLVDTVGIGIVDT